MQQWLTRSVCPTVVRGKDLREVCEEMHLRNALQPVPCVNQEAAQNVASALC